jgi:hypothetical protein
MKARHSRIWTVLFWMVLIGVFTTLMSLVSSPFLFLWFINTPYPYDPPQKNIEYFTDVPLSDSTSIDRCCVRNFFFLDGPDYYYELTLSPKDRKLLINSFGGPGETPLSENYCNAIARVPSAWIRGLHPQVKCYHLVGENYAEVWLDVDVESNKAWLAILNY